MIQLAEEEGRERKREERKRDRRRTESAYAGTQLPRLAKPYVVRTVRRCVRTFVLYQRTRRPPRIKLSGEFRELRHVRERASEQARACARTYIHTHIHTSPGHREESPTWVRDCGALRGRGERQGRARFRDSLEDISHFRAAPEA